MSKKTKKIIMNLVFIVIFIIGTGIFYNKFTNIHDNYCCEGMTQCPFFICSSESPKLIEFEMLGFALFFCGAGVVFETIYLIKNILKEDKKRNKR